MSHDTTTPDAPIPAARSRRIAMMSAAVLVAVVVVTGFFAMGWHRALRLENVVAIRDRFHGVLAMHWWIALCGYIGIYAVTVSLSLPGSLVLTLTGGLMFGWLAGGLAAVVGATLGASIVFFIARSAFGDVFARKAGPLVQRLSAGFRENALSYLLFLRLVPAFPFFLVNLVPGLVGVPFVTYLVGTFFGIIPAALAFASVGAGFDSVLAAARADQAACLAQKAPALCPLGISAGNLLTTEIKIAFALLGCIALLPIAYKKWSAHNGHGG